MMIKIDASDELNSAIEMQAYIQSVNRQVHKELGYDLSTLYIFSQLQQVPDGVEIMDLAKVLKISASALSLRLSLNVRQGLIHVENAALDRRTKRVYLTEQGRQTVAELSPELKRILKTH